MEPEESEVAGGLEPGGLKESMIIPISEEGLLEHEGVESPRLASKEGLGEDVAKLVEHDGADSSRETLGEVLPEEVCEPVDLPAFHKHIFVLSEAGKPIYSRHGDEELLVTTMGVMQALSSCIQDRNQDQIRFIKAGRHRFVYLLRLPLVLVGVSSWPHLSFQQLQNHLLYMYNEIVCVLTHTVLIRVFEQRSNFDLRRMLGGSERQFDTLCDRMDIDASFLLGAVRCLPLAASVRDQITQVIVQPCSKMKDLVFAILVADNHLVAMGRMKKYQLHPVDLHLIFNLVESSQNLKDAETWLPICLPKFDASAFLHAHVSYLDEACISCLLLVTVRRDQFFELQECRSQIVERLQKGDFLSVIADSVAQSGYSARECGILELRHFIYKAKSSAQLSSARFEGIYQTDEGRRRLIGLYHVLHARMFNSARPLKILYSAGERETQLGWHMIGFELYATFEPLVTKEGAVKAMNKLLHWIKKEEDRLFIMNSATF
ncbi:vacuolar fusion protein MON1A-like [Tropilaelaps mercedesae]|uniref:Vacuolar fusion protein MON1 homolog n=1 Tax=Tropilaelaps mercedesae TaxID=418985 RepID=A0A1V9X8W0_9ACAR|nr:vacuolar fusion protein MON1A-like [Tropilaelaps mercedesae]